MGLGKTGRKDCLRSRQVTDLTGPRGQQAAYLDCRAASGCSVCPSILMTCLTSCRLELEGCLRGPWEALGHCQGSPPRRDHLHRPCPCPEDFRHRYSRWAPLAEVSSSRS